MNIIVFSPHTDDAELGCGGSLTKWMREGHNILSVVFSLCEKSIPNGFDKDVTKKEFIKNMQSLGCEFETWNAPVREFPSYRQEILDIMFRHRQFNPDLILIPSLNDIHQDHKVIAEEAVRAFRCSILSYELFYTSLDFKPQHYVELTEEDIKNKIKLLGTYESQIVKGKGYTDRDYIYGLAKIRGTQIDKQYAEAFECVRFVS